jgi:hypothetical protein
MNEPSRAPRTWRDAQIVQLTLVRFREFLREPEALFWVFIFPVLLTAGLGLAFRNRPPDKIAVALVAAGAYNDQSIQTRAATMNIISERSKDADGVAARVMTLDSAMSVLAQNKIAIIAILDSGRRVTYRYDPANEEARRGRLVLNDLLESDYGRANRLTTKGDYITAPGSRYVDFLVPGLLGMNLLGSGVWGLGFALVDLRRKRLLKRLVATPMSRAQFFTSFLLSRLVVLSFEVIALAGIWRGRFTSAGLRVDLAVFFIAVFRRASLRGQRPACSSGRAREDGRGCLGSRERHHASDVGPLRNVLLGEPLSRSDATGRARAAAHGGE